MSQPPNVGRSTRAPQYGHLRFVGGRVYCPRAGRRIDLGTDHRYGEAFTCPGCNVFIGASRSVAVTLDIRAEQTKVGASLARAQAALDRVRRALARGVDTGQDATSRSQPSDASGETRRQP